MIESERSAKADNALVGQIHKDARAGRPVARLAPLARPARARKPGSAKGRVTMAADFDAPLPREIQKAFA
ncbi:MAG: DUF2281 domain-containing protein [Deltaproteobacteria bacterium]|nr:DUF2281 domain-containing protein [Deltaproteobacteria bacterium]